MQRKRPSTLRRLVNRFIVVFGSVGLTLLFFLALPAIQVLAAESDEVVELVEAPQLWEEPDVEVEEEEEEDEQEEPEPEPELDQPEVEMTLEALTDALNPGGLGTGVGLGGFDFELGDSIAESFNVDAIFSGGSKTPARIRQGNWPSLPRRLARRTPVEMTILCRIDKNGKLVDAIVQRTEDDAFNSFVLNAIKRFRFEPAKVEGKPVDDQVRIPVEFKKPN